MKITKQQLRRIIKEEKRKIISEQNEHQMYARDDELRELGDTISQMVVLSRQVELLMSNMGSRYGELVALGTDARTARRAVQGLEDKYASKLDDVLRFSK